MEKEYKYPKSIHTLIGLLKRHDIRISTSHKTRIKGWHDHTAGISISKKYDNTFYVMEYHGAKWLPKAYEAMKSEGFHIADENMPNSFLVHGQKPD